MGINWKINILDITTKKEFCDFFSISEYSLNPLLQEDFKNALIKEFKISKKNWGFRVVYKITNDFYKTLLRSISQKFSEVNIFDDYVQWFSTWKSTITNARLHLNKKIIIHADIKDFFSNIKINDSFFSEMWFNQEISTLFQYLCLYNGILPTGFPTSHILSNIFCKNMDLTINWLTKERGYIYSRYWDDITLSTDTDYIFTKEEISNILNKYWFTLNNKKFKVEKKWWPQYVTWLTVVNKKNPHIPRRIKRRIRLELYHIAERWLSEHIKNSVDKEIEIMFDENIAKKLSWWIWYMFITEPALIKYIFQKEKIIESRAEEYWQECYRQNLQSSEINIIDMKYIK